MTPTPTAWRITAAATAVSMTFAGVSPGMAAPPPIAVQNQVSPPSRVGRLAHYTGTVSFHTADQTEWSPATLNYPITTGNALWTEPSADALVEVSGNRVAMNEATEFDIATLDDHALVGSTPQGELYLSLRQVPNGDTYTIQTPRGAVQIAAMGRYEVVAGDTDHPTTVTVVEGAAQITGTNVTLQVGSGQTAAVDGSTTFQGSVGPMRQDAFLTKMLAQERPAPRSAVAMPPVVAQMTGCEDLDQYGSWSDTPQNGAVWYPKVDSGWVPYRHGRWSYVAPWGWTWVDDAPWGFAPFHYGRWIQTDDRWGWVPVEPAVQAYSAPVYAPALISWVDIGAAVAVGAAAGALLGGGDRSVGWVPLGPNEPYYPSYSNSVNYVRTMNGPNIRNVNQVITNVTVNNRTVTQTFINRGGATVVPASVMARSAPIAGAARPVSPQQFAQARSQVQPPITPTAATIGITPDVARRFNFVPAARPGIAGPAINPAAFHPTGGRGSAPGFVPPLRPVNTTGGPGAPAEPPHSPGPAPNRPGETSRAGAPGPVMDLGRPEAPDVARPGVLPGLRPATPPGSEPGRPPGVVAQRIEQPRAAEPGRPNEPVRPGAPATVPEAVRPAGPAPTPHPAESLPRIGEPGRPGPSAEPTRPAAVVPPVRAPEARPVPAVEAPRPAPPAPRPAPPARPTPPPRPAPVIHQAPPRPAPQAHPAPQARAMPQPHQAPQARPAPPHPAGREEHR